MNIKPKLRCISFLKGASFIYGKRIKIPKVTCCSLCHNATLEPPFFRTLLGTRSLRVCCVISKVCLVKALK